MNLLRETLFRIVFQWSVDRSVHPRKRSACRFMLWPTAAVQCWRYEPARGLLAFFSRGSWPAVLAPRGTRGEGTSGKFDALEIHPWMIIGRDRSGTEIVEPCDLRTLILDGV